MSIPITRTEQATPAVKPAKEVEGDVPVILISIVIVVRSPGLL
jgi:hypothetical protein